MHIEAETTSRAVANVANVAIGPSDASPDPLGLSRGANYTLLLPEFEGPLDLLLHLVKKHELDIFNIPIAFITTQYVLALEQMHALNMDVASEYLLMAATLTYIKSRELLPPEAQPEELDEFGERLEEGDPRETLIKRLLDYQKWKNAAAELASRPVVGRNVWTREAPPESALGDILTPAPLESVPVWELIDLLAKLHGKRQKKLTHEVTVERLSLADRINQVNELLDAAPLLEPVFKFDTVLTRLYARGQSSDFGYEIVLTFLALLEMARLRLLVVYQPVTEEPGQPEQRGSIYVSRPGITASPNLAPPDPPELPTDEISAEASSDAEVPPEVLADAEDQTS